MAHDQAATSRRAAFPLGRLVFAAAATLALASCSFGTNTEATPRVLKGIAYVNGDATAIAFQPPHDSAHFAFGVGDVQWEADPVDGWHDGGRPACLKPLTMQPLEVGFISAKASTQAPGRDVVAWLRCL